MSHPSDTKWLPSPVLSQRAESQRDVTDAAPPQPSGGAHALLDGMYTELSRRQDAQQLLLLTRRRHLLTLTRQFVVHQMSLMSYIHDVCELLRQSPPPVPSNMAAVCARLRRVTSYSALLHRRLQSDPCLYPIPSTSMLEATRNIPRVLLLMAVKAALLTEQYILRVLRRVARVPAEVTADLCRSLTTYNQVVADLSKQAILWAELRPFCLGRVLEILAEERSQLLVAEFYCTWFQGGLEDTLRREMDTDLNKATGPANRLQETSQVVSGLGVIDQENILREMETHTSQARDPTLRPSSSLQKTSRVVSGLGVNDQKDRLSRKMETHMSQARDPTLRPANSLQETSRVVPGLGVIDQEDILRREMETHMSQARDPTLRPSNSLQETSQVVSGIGVIDQEDTLRREMETHMSQARDPTLRPSNSLQKTSRVVPGLGVIDQEDILRRDMKTRMSQARDPTLRPANSLQETSQVVPGLGVIDQEDILRRDMETRMSQARDPTLRPSNSLQETSRVVSGQRSFSNLGVLIQEDRSQVTPVLQILVGLDQKMWSKVPGGSEPALYSQYCVRLWLALYSQVFHGVSSGMRGPRTTPGLMLLPERVCARAVQILREALMSEDLPEPCVSLGLSLCQRLLCVRSLVAWDSTLCQALSSALTDKCAASSLGRGDPFPGNHSRTSGILVTLCQHLSGLQVTPSSSHPSSSREPRNLGDRLFPELGAVTCQEGVLSRGTVSLHLCDVWLRSRTQIYTSSGSLGQLVLITHGDLPVIKVECRSLVAAAENADLLAPPHRSCMRLQRTRDVLEGLVVSLPHVLGSVCSRRAQDFFQHMMPAGRHWRGKLVTGPDPAPSGYAEAAVSAVVVPVLDGATSLRMEEQVPAVCVAVGVLMEAWMGHILREKIKFSLQGALQLRRDFENVRDVLRSRESRMPPEVVQTALALPVFAQADNAIVCLLQQPSRKTYLQSGSCAVFSCCPPLCRVAVDSMSDSLQSLDSLERRAWDGGVSRRVPRHSHDSYLPHNQRQWLSLRVNKTWNGLSLPWEGREVSEG